MFVPGALRSRRVGLAFKFDKNSTKYSASYFNLGVMELCLGGLRSPKPPRGDGTGEALQQNRIGLDLAPLSENVENH